MKEAHEIYREIKELIKDWEPKLEALNAEMITERRNSQNRSIKMILGHLIDSASNNIHRIVHLQYQESPLTFPNYATNGNNDRWIAVQNYQAEDWNTMIMHWKFSYLHYCHVIGNVNDNKLGNQWIAGPGRLISLHEMILDFLRHFKLHLSEIDELIKSN